MTWGDIANIFNSNNVRFSVGRDSGTSDPVEEVVLMDTFKMEKDLPVQRDSVRAGPAENPDWLLREIIITALVTKDLYDKLEAISEETSRGGFFIEDFELNAESIGGDSKNSTLSCDGFVRHLSLGAIKGQKYTVTFIIRVINNTVVIS